MGSGGGGGAPRREGGSYGVSAGLQSGTESSSGESKSGSELAPATEVSSVAATDDDEKWLGTVRWERGWSGVLRGSHLPTEYAFMNVAQS